MRSARPHSYAIAAIACSLTPSCSAALDAPGSSFLETPPLLHYLEAPQPQPYTHFGDRVALSGSALAITAPFEVAAGAPAIPELGGDDNTADGEGATYLFDLSQDAAPLRIIAPHADLGDGKLPVTVLNVVMMPTFKNLPAMSVALNDDWLAIGAAGEDGGLPPTATPGEAEADNSAESAGAVYVYARSRLAAGDLTPAQYIKAPNIGALDYFGASVIWAGAQLIVGAPGEDGGRLDDPRDDSAADSGAVYVYSLRDDHFEFDQYLKTPAPITANDLFGFSLGADGDLLAVGAPLDSSAATTIGGDRDDTSLADGAAYLFRHGEAGWQHEEYLKPSAARAASLFGWSVRVSNGRVAVGAPGAANCGGEKLGVDVRGAVYLFDGAAGGWTLGSCLGPAARRGSFFGASIGLFGERTLIGAPWDESGLASDPADSSRPFSGAAYLFERGERSYLKARQPGDFDVFGSTVELGERLAVIGASQRSQDERGGLAEVYAGGVYVFDVAR